MDKNNTAINRDRIFYGMDICSRWSIYTASIRSSLLKTYFSNQRYPCIESEEFKYINIIQNSNKIFYFINQVKTMKKKGGFYFRYE